MNPLEARPANVWQFAQNKPSLIVGDFARLFGVPIVDSMRILAARGVCKWLAARRDIIRAKDRWRAQITETLEEIRDAKKAGDRDRLMRLRGKLEALNACRQEIRRICHSERWRIPDHDRLAKGLLVIAETP